MVVAWDVKPSGLVRRFVSGFLTSLMRFGNAEISCGECSVEYSRRGAEDTSGVCCLLGVAVFQGCGEWWVGVLRCCLVAGRGFSPFWRGTFGLHGIM